MSEVILEVGSNRLSGWQRIDISREIGSFCGSFSIGLLDSWSELNKAWYIKPFSACRVFIDNDLVLTGFVDNVSISKSSSGTGITISGRDKTSDLVDCSVELSSYEIPKKTIVDLAKTLTKKFGIEFVTDVEPGAKFNQISINQGARVASVLEDYARYRGFLFMTDGLGRLVLVKPGASQAHVALILGQNIKSFEARYDTQQRFSTYTVLSQIPAETAAAFGTASNQVEGKSVDPGVTRYRPMTFQADLSAGAPDAKKRAEWEANTRAAKSESLTIVVVGWRQGPEKTDPLWEINLRVYVKIPELGIDGEYLIGSVRYSFDSGGQIAELGIERPDAYAQEPLADPGISKGLDFADENDD